MRDEGTNRSDQYWMRRCLELARRGAGRVSPNPMVGAVLVGADGEKVLGEGVHEQYGGPHAEVNAFADVEEEAALKSATLYVNLEPCAHHGKTPPCTELILQKGIARVVVGMTDPHPDAGGGLARLQAAGVDSETGVLSEECRRLNEAFTHHVTTGRPLVTLKQAQTLDGRIATRSGDSRWISGEASRNQVHRWRAAVDAVLVGSGTARADDPRLTVRRTEGSHPLRLVLDRAGALSPDLRLFSDAHPCRTAAVVGAERPDPPYAEALCKAGGAVVRVPERDGHLHLPTLLERLGSSSAAGRTRPVQSIMVEAGPRLATSLLRQDLADRVFIFVAPKLLGEGQPAIGDMGIREMTRARTFTETCWEPVGDDMLFRGYCRALEP